jgi:hypothetical protein
MKAMAPANGRKDGKYEIVEGSRGNSPNDSPAANAPLRALSPEAALAMAFLIRW